MLQLEKCSEVIGTQSPAPFTKLEGPALETKESQDRFKVSLIKDRNGTGCPGFQGREFSTTPSCFLEFAYCSYYLEH